MAEPARTVVGRWRAVAIEDQPGLLALYRAMLQDSRIDLVAESLTARGGVAAVRREHPDLVILDLGLPDLDGLEVLPEIVATGATVAVVSAFQRQAVEDEARRRGAAVFIEKGGSPLALVDRLERLMDETRSSASVPGAAEHDARRPQ